MIIFIDELGEEAIGSAKYLRFFNDLFDSMNGDGSGIMNDWNDLQMVVSVLQTS